jgi:hypothetical protein
MSYREIRNFYCHYLLESHVNFTCTHLSDCSTTGASLLACAYLTEACGFRVSEKKNAKFC